MTPITDTGVKVKGIGSLVDALDEEDAERFISLLNREPFDYTMWEAELFQGLDLRAISKLAMNFRNSKTT